MEDLLSASAAWHSLSPDRALNDEQSLRTAFDKLDLDGSGKIDTSELRHALLAQLHEEGVDTDAMVDDMISFAGDRRQIRTRFEPPAFRSGLTLEEPHNRARSGL